jgi:hypothetical protein
VNVYSAGDIVISAPTLDGASSFVMPDTICQVVLIAIVRPPGVDALHREMAEYE